MLYIYIVRFFSLFVHTTTKKRKPHSALHVKDGIMVKTKDNMATCHVVNVLCPNGRRQKIKLTAQTTILQVLLLLDTEI